MNKTIAHLIFLAIDIAAIYLAYYVLKMYWQLTQDIQTGVDRVSYQWPFGLLLILLVIPLIHIISVILQGSSNSSLSNILMIAGSVAIVAVIVILNIKISGNLQSYDYEYNSKDSKWMTFSMFKYYDKKK